MSRDEYLQSVEEGFIKDTLKKGWEKVKSFFKLGFKKIKDFLAVVDSKGNVLPVVSLQATIDRAASLDCVQVYAPSEVSALATEAGGQGCEENASAPESDEIYNDGPDGRKEYSKWMSDGKFKETNEYKNFMTMTSMVAESCGATKEEVQKMFESWEGQTAAGARIKLVDNEQELKGMDQMYSDEFFEMLEKKVNDWSVRRGKDRVRMMPNGVKKIGKVMGNILIFGAPGIGKSTVPNAVVKAYNKNISNPNDKISLININCANIKPGDFMMPTMPKEVNIVSDLESFKDAFPQASAAIAELNPKQKEEIANMISHSGQFKATDAPKSWLPSYRPTGNDFIDKLLNDAANGGVYDEDGQSMKVGGGGIILFDEFLRCDPDVFGELMNFLQDRKLNGWQLGDRWAIIACSNRPVDDGQVAEVWNGWFPAARDRWDRMIQLVPTVEEWKEWARSKGCDELILKFIFDKNAEGNYQGDENEVTRWHTAVKNGAGDSQQVKPVTPRQWERVFTAISDYEIEHDYVDISEMSEKEIRKALKGAWGTEFLEEFIGWLQDHTHSVDMGAIMKNPLEVYLPNKFIKDPGGEQVLIQNLLEQFSEKFKKDPASCDEDALANICIWLGINFKEDMYSVLNFVRSISEKVFKLKSGTSFDRYIKVGQILEAAFPPHDIEDDIKMFTTRPNFPWPEDSMDILKDYMKKYFPWRLKEDGSINFYDALD